MTQTQAIPLSFDLQLALPFQAALTAVRDALKAEGFGILTEIDLQAAFREKLGKEFRDFRILGACNPPLAYQAISADPAVALLLPCNVTVEAEAHGGTRIRFANPEALLAWSSAAPPLMAVAQDA